MKTENTITKSLIHKYWLSKLSDAGQFNVYSGLSGINGEFQMDLPSHKDIVSVMAKKDPFAEYALHLSMYVSMLKLHYNLSEIVIAVPPLKLSERNNSGGICFYKYKLDEDCTLKDILKITQREIEESVKYQDYSFSDMVPLLKEKNISLGSLFRFSFALTALNEPLSDHHCGFVFSVSKEQQGVKFRFGGVFDAADHFTAKQFVERYLVFSESFETALLKPVKNATVFLPGEKEKILKFNDQTPAGLTYGSITALFEEWAEKMPDKTALVTESGNLSYQRLNAKCNQLSRYICEKHGVAKGTPVAMMLPRTEHAVIAIMAILKAGGVYVPVDPNYPEERISYILKSTNAKVLMTFSSLSSKIKEYDGKVMFLDFQLDMLTTPSHNLQTELMGDDLAYIIHTSGSTGKPKGVMVEHRSVVRLVQNTNYIQISDTDNVFALSNFAFDGSVFDVFGALCNGATMVLATKEMSLDMVNFSEVLRKNNITVFFVTTALFNSLVDNLLEDLSGVRKILFGGEIVSVRHVNTFVEKHGAGKLIHVYGPTENTTFSTFFPVDKAGWVKTVPIGKPITATGCHVVNSDHILLPVGMAGELCVSGTGLAKGYFSDDTLTGTKFITLPETKEKVYKTGDLVRWLPSGDVEFIGRVDNQVKIRGYRIELEEIEKIMLSYEGIKGAAALVSESKAGDKYITGYFETHSTINISDLNEYLKKYLPDIMVPQKYCPLEKFPLNSNGKINKKALAEFVIPDVDEKHVSYVAPATKTEELIASLWREILSMDQIGTKDNFFEQGGHSLKAAQFIARLFNETGVKLELKSIFATPYVMELAQLVDAEKKKLSPGTNYSIKAVVPTDYYELSHAQKRFFIVDQFNNNNSAYNVTSTYLLEGEIDPAILKKAVNSVMLRHESLRTTFELVKGMPAQKIHPELFPEWNEKDISGDPDKEDLARNMAEVMFAATFDLAKGPLLRINLLHLSANQHLLLLSAHHIICDGWSMKILENEIILFYNQYKFSKTASLPVLNIQYKDFAAWQNRMIEKHAGNDREYWHNKLSGDLPSDYLSQNKGDKNQENQASVHTFIVKDEILSSLRNYNKRTGVTMFITLTGIIKFLIYRYTSHRDVIIGTDVVLRDDPSLENQVGLYLNNLVLRTAINDNNTYSEYSQKIKSTVIEAFDHKLYPYDKLMEEFNRFENGNARSFFDVFLVYRNYNVSSLDNIKTGSFESVTAEKFMAKPGRSKFNLTVGFSENEKELICNLEYNTSQFDEKYISRLAADLQKMITMIPADDNLLLKQFKEQLMDEKENQMIAGAKEKAINDISEDF
jgi:amino acid adenylation domain-containing protein